MFQVWAYFILKLLAPDRVAACSISFRTSCLAHKSLDYSMENQIVVIAVFSMCREILNCFGAFIGEEFAVDLAHRRVDDNFRRQYFTF